VLLDDHPADVAVEAARDRNRVRDLAVAPRQDAAETACERRDRPERADSKECSSSVVGRAALACRGTVRGVKMVVRTVVRVVVPRGVRMVVRTVVTLATAVRRTHDTLVSHAVLKDSRLFLGK
jgi:hypothetical protein